MATLSRTQLDKFARKLRLNISEDAGQFRIRSTYHTRPEAGKLYDSIEMVEEALISIAIDKGVALPEELLVGEVDPSMPFDEFAQQVGLDGDPEADRVQELTLNQLSDIAVDMGISLRSSDDGQPPYTLYGPRVAGTNVITTKNTILEMQDFIFQRRRLEKTGDTTATEQELQDLQDDIAEATRSLENIETAITRAPFIAPTEKLGLDEQTRLEGKRDKLKDDIKNWQRELVVIQRSVDRAKATPDPRQQERRSAYQDYLVDKATEWKTEPLTQWEESAIRRIGTSRAVGKELFFPIREQRSTVIRSILERIDRGSVDDWHPFVRKQEAVRDPTTPPPRVQVVPSDRDKITVSLDEENDQAIREWIVVKQNPGASFSDKSLELETGRIDQTLVDMVDNIVRQAIEDAGIDYVQDDDLAVFYQIHFSQTFDELAVDPGGLIEGMTFDTRLSDLIADAKFNAISELQKLEELPMGQGQVPDMTDAEIYLKAALKDMGLSTEKIRELNTRAMAIQLLDIAKTELVGEPQVFRQADGELVVDPDVQHRKLVELATELAQTGKVSDLELISRGIEDIPVAQELMNAAAVAGTLPETLSDDYTKYLIGEATRLTNDWMAEIARKGDKANRDEFVAKRAAGLLTEEELAKQLEDEAEKKRRTPAVIAREELDERSRLFWSEAFRTEKMSADATQAQRDKLWLAYDEAKGQYDTAKLAGQQPNFEEIIAGVLEPLPVIVVTEGARRAREAPSVPVGAEFTAAGQPMISSLQDRIATGDQRLADIGKELFALAKSDTTGRATLEAERETLTETQKTMQTQLDAILEGTEFPADFVRPAGTERVGMKPGAFEGQVGQTAAFALTDLEKREQAEVDRRLQSLREQRLLDLLGPQGRAMTSEEIQEEMEAFSEQIEAALPSRKEVLGQIYAEQRGPDLEPRPQWLQPGGFPAGTPLRLVGDIVKKMPPVLPKAVYVPPKEDVTPTFQDWQWQYGVEPGGKIPGVGTRRTAIGAQKAADRAADAEAEQEAEQAAAEEARLAAEAVVPEKTPAEIAEEEAAAERARQSAVRRPRTQRIIT